MFFRQNLANYKVRLYNHRCHIVAFFNVVSNLLFENGYFLAVTCIMLFFFLLQVRFHRVNGLNDLFAGKNMLLC
jgi:hypothetical protein